MPKRKTTMLTMIRGMSAPNCSNHSPAPVTPMSCNATIIVAIMISQ